jgi:hypothetical protein
MSQQVCRLIARAGHPSGAAIQKTITNPQQRIFPDQAVSGVECAASRINTCGRFACEFCN